MIHPYWGQDLFGFFVVLFWRVIAFFMGEAGEITIDEAQILVLGLTGITTSLIGSLLVYRRMAMIANSISHTILLGIVITYLFGLWNLEGGLQMTNLLAAALCTSVLTYASTNFFVRTLKVQKDASIGLVFTTLLALGIIFITVFTKNAHIGTELILGNIDLLQTKDIFPTFWLTVITLGVISFFYRPFLISTFDPVFGASLKISVRVYDHLMMLITSAAVVSSFRIVGVALVLALLILPPMTSRLFTKRFPQMMLVAAIINLCVAVFSVALTRACLSVYGTPLSTSGMMVTLLFITYLMCACYKKGLRGEKTSCNFR